MQTPCDEALHSIETHKENNSGLKNKFKPCGMKLSVLGCILRGTRGLRRKK
jgi:hypothetical protein